MLYRKSVILIVALLCLTISKDCFSAQPVRGLTSIAIPHIPNFLSGRHKLTNTNNLPQRYNPFSISLKIPLKDAEAALSIYDMTGYDPKDGLDFFLTTGKVSSTSLEVMFVIEKEAKWAWIEVNYVLSSRADFAVGIFTADSAALMQGHQGQSVQVYHHLPKLFEKHHNFIYAIPFICGARTFDHSLYLSFSKSSYDSNLNVLQLEININYNKYPLESLYISYLIFNMNSDLRVTSLADPDSAPTNQHVFLGLSGLKPAGQYLDNDETEVAGGPLRSNSSPNEKQAFEMIFGINGVVVQTQQHFDIFTSSDGQQRSISSAQSTSSFDPECTSNDRCIQQGGVMVYRQEDVFEISSKCYVCSHGKFDSEKSKCACDQGFGLQDGVCVAKECQNGQFYSPVAEKCICPQWQIERGGVCYSRFELCPRGYIWFNQNCIPVFTEKMRCPDSMKDVNGKCVARQSCGTNQEWRDDECRCKDGLHLISGECRQCGQNAHYNGNGCACNPGYEGDGYSCRQSEQPVPFLTLSSPFISQPPRG